MQPQKTGPFPYTPITRRPRLHWPDKARLALWVAPNVEVFPLDRVVPFGTGSNPDVLGWSQRDYGNRVAFFRLADVLTKYGIRGTVALNSDMCDAHPAVVEYAMERGWEFMSHGQTNSQYVTGLDAAAEAAYIKGSFDRIESFTGKRPRGWLAPGVQMTWNTLDCVLAAGGQYVCDFVNDDQPYLMDVGGKRLVSVPYSSEINDLPQFLRNMRTADEFETMIKRQFDVLYREGAESGRVMCISVHPFIIGVPHRIQALDNALAYICSYAGVWKTTGSEIVDHYLQSGATF